MMSEMGEFYRDMREHDRERREASHKEASAMEWPVQWVKHDLYHWSVMLQGARCDYWPSTNRMRWRGKTRRMNADQFAQFLVKLVAQ